MDTQVPQYQQPSGSSAGWESLTRAELRVAQLVVRGLSNRAVAERLVVSPHTVDTHLRRVYKKLSVRSRVELTRQALLLDLPERSMEPS